MGNLITRRRLKKLDPGRVVLFTLQGVGRRWVRVCQVYDGDTVTIITFVRGEPFKFKVRMHGYDSPEMKPRLDAPMRHLEIESAKVAKQGLENMLGNGIVQLEFKGWDKYGRVLGILFDEKGKNINQTMVDGGYGVPYDGGKKTAFVA